MRRLLVTALIATALSVVPPPARAEDCEKAAKISREAAGMISSNPALAAGRLREAVSLCDKSASLYYNLGLALHNQGEYEKAKGMMEAALSLKPDYAKALNDLAYIYLTRDKNRFRAELLARRAVLAEPQNKNYQDTLYLVLKAEQRTVDIETPPRIAINKPNAVAVVIGNRNYKNALIPAVQYADRDADLIRKYLIETLGFRESNIINLRDADEADFKKIFGDKEDHRGILYSRTRKDESEIFIYYSGHGGPDTNTKEGYLIPANADPFAIRFTAYPLNTLYDNLAKLTADKNPRSLVLVLDACFSGAYNDGMLIRDASPITIELTTPLLKMRNAVAFTSSQGNQISSWYPEKGHGLFTYHFLKALKEDAEARKTVTAGDVEKALMGNDGVNDDAWRLYNREQIPQIVGDKSIVLVQ